MSLYLTPEQKEKGKAAFNDAANKHPLVTRRELLTGALAAIPVAGLSLAAVYYGYESLRGSPVKAGLIGAGDEGGVLVGNHNPDFLEFIGYSDIRPYNQKRIMDGEGKPPRWGFKYFYGNDADKKIVSYPDYKKLLDNKDIEAVVIALPLHLHAQVAIDAMKAGKHVLCEKLMAWNVHQCKEMIKVAEETNRILTIGHQRHYSLLYAHALEVIKAGTLGDVRHIRALWHRNNAWPKINDKGEIIKDEHGIVYHDGWHPPIRPEDREALDAKIKDLGYKNMEELIRWRLFNRTGGGLMAELGSHQLDACSIFLGKVHPLAVTGVGGKFFYRDEREVDDHVYVNFEFPGPNYWEKDNDGKPTNKVKDGEDRVVVTYSSINTNTFEPYGECVMGSKGTLIVETEATAMLVPERDPNTRTGGSATGSVVTAAGGGKPAVESSGSTGAIASPALVAGGAPVSRGYTEEMAHFAYCVKMHQKAEKEKNAEEQQKWRLTPRCHGKVAMADAIIALTSNLAMKNKKRIEFKEEWFDPKSKEVPDPDMKAVDQDGKELTL
jgi:predicted dehydrogenase